MTVFVQRDEDNKICGVFALPQPDYATEELADDNAEVVAFLNPPVKFVTARQFGVQLAILGLMPQVEAWVAQQNAQTQWAFNRSGTFVRDDPMMEAGFTALGFTKEQIDAFFEAASLL